MARRLLILLLALAVMTEEASAARRSKTSAAEVQVISESPDSSRMRTFDCEGYVVHTDLPEGEMPDILRRLNAMTRHYVERTAGLSVQSDSRRLPLYLYSQERDYVKAGGQKGSAGFFDGEQLLAVVGRQADGRAWHVIQHEAFHQFLYAKLGDQLPIWLNEGLAEYFGEGIYTGDDFLTGMIPAYRVKRLRESFQRERAPVLGHLLSLSHEQWNEHLNKSNYDYAWSLIHFLAHAENGARRDDLVGLILKCARGADSSRTFAKSFGDVDLIEAAWREYWNGLSAEQINRPWASAAARTVAGVLGRAFAAHQRVESLDQLAELVRSKRLRMPEGDWVPLSQVSDCLELAPGLGRWQLDSSPRAKANVTLILPDDSAICVQYTLRMGQVQSIREWSLPGKR